MKALAKDKNVRYQTAANMQKDLNRFINTQFPDFSTHDFSAFIKDCFKSAYTEGREKLLQYAKIENTIETLTATTETIKAPPSLTDLINNPQMTGPAPQSVAAKTEPKEQPAMPKGLSTEQQAKISLDGIRNMGVSSQKANASLRQASRAMASSSAAEPGQSTRVTQVTQMTKFSKTGSKSSYKKSNDMDLLMKFVVVGVLGIASFWGYKSFIATGPSVAQKSKPVEKVQVAELASQAKVNLSLKSYPSGAKIYIDGESTGRTTPAIIAVTANKDARIVLLKDGYSPYETTKQFSQTSTFEATLQLQEIGGYVNIYVINGGARPALFINGQRLSEVPPIKRYRVPANKDLVIRAENMITQLSDEVSLKVRQEQVADVELILGRTQGPKK
jgi:eukaryotic-like serine/threonine-protein kinase